ncbi:MAG TPA: hypothetical protein VFQ53_05180 [Kofleriaceae bacterium]|nr:hypothetical protein [Kofleriaceae bacterium]
MSTGIARADRWTERCKSRLAPIAKTLAAADRDAKVRVDAPFEATSPWLEGNVDGVALTVDMQGTRVLTVAIADFDSPRFAHGWEMILTLPADEPDVRRERRYFYTPDRRLTRLDEPDGATLDWFGYAHRRGKRLAWFTATTPLDVALVARIERAVERAADECLQLR